jgi:O-glycosyl hydrolase
MVFYRSKDESQGLPVIAFVRPGGKRVIIVGNLTDDAVSQSIAVGRKFLNAQLPPHSFTTFAEK